MNIIFCKYKMIIICYLLILWLERLYLLIKEFFGYRLMYLVGNGKLLFIVCELIDILMEIVIFNWY